MHNMHMEKYGEKIKDSLFKDGINNALVAVVLPRADVPHQVGHACHQLLEVHLLLNNIQNNNSNDNNFGNIQIFKVWCV